MLSKPKSGWTNFKLSETGEYSLSYLDDIPMNWLEDAIHGLEYYRPFCVYANMEPECFICIVNYDSCQIIIETEDGMENSEDIYSIEVSQTNMLEFCKMLCDDIKIHIDDWANFVDYNGENPAKKKRELIRKIKKLEKIIEKKDIHK